LLAIKTHRQCELRARAGWQRANKGAQEKRDLINAITPWWKTKNYEQNKNDNMVLRNLFVFSGVEL
jgi:hypothetical protein